MNSTFMFNLISNYLYLQLIQPLQIKFYKMKKNVQILIKNQI